jgi:Ca-activated chloride channel family protein
MPNQRRIPSALVVVGCLAGLASASTHPPQTTDRRDRVPVEAARPVSPSEVSEASLIYHDPISGRYEIVALEHTEVSIDVRGLVAVASVAQRYRNDTEQALEAVYVFPLPHQAAVYDMEIRIGDRVIRSVIQERAEAQQTYRQAKAAGKRAALVEQERPNVFTASVANIMPGDVIDVRVRYVEPLTWSDGKVRLVFPMVVGPRYIPGEATGRSGTGWADDTDAVPDASRITPPVRHPSSRPGHDIGLRVRLEPGVRLGEIRCPTHPVAIDQPEPGLYEVRLASEATLPNRDFVLEYQRAEAPEARAALFLSPQPEGDETHFILVAYPPTLRAQDERAPVDLLFVIDVSGSMAGTSIEQARAALLQGLDRLRSGDRFGIVAFNDEFETFLPETVSATPDRLAEGRRFVSGLGASGGTEMLPALEHAMALPRLPGFVREIVLLTDGCLGNENQIFRSLEQNLGEARLFTVAIGSAPNHYLATRMAEYGRGAFSHIADASEIETQMAALLDTIESPVLTDISVGFEGAEVADLYPSRPGDLFLSRPLVLMGRLLGGRSGVLHLAGSEGGVRYQQEIPFDVAEAEFHPGITTLWARERLKEEIELWRRSPGDAERAERRGTIVQDAIRYHLVSRFTSLVAVEEVVANTGASPRTVRVPTELPAGWKLEKVFGSNPSTGTADDFLAALGLVLLALGLVLFGACRLREVWS